MKHETIKILFSVVLYFCIAVFLPVSRISAQSLSGSDDLRPRVPERWSGANKYKMDLTLGGSSLSGNVDATNIIGGFSVKYLIEDNRELLLEGNTVDSKLNGTAIQDKKKLSFLYIYKWKRGVNLFFNSTVAKNRAIKLDRRITYSFPGICWHGLMPDKFDLFLFSLSPTWQREKFNNNTHFNDSRVTLRLNFEKSLTGTTTLGGDFLYLPKWSDMDDYQAYTETYLKFVVSPDKCDMKISYGREIDSKPLPGVRKVDSGIFYSVSYHFNK